MVDSGLYVNITFRTVYLMAKALIHQAAVARSVGTFVHLAEGNITEEVEHLLLLSLVLIE